MLDNFIYENHLGQRFSGLECGVYLNIGELRDYTWTHETINNRISRFYRKTTNRKIPLYVVGKTYEQAAEAMNRLFDITEADIAANIPGSVFVGDYYTRGFITTSKKTKYLDNRQLCKIDLTLTSDDPAWYRNTMYAFYTDATTPKAKKSGNIVTLNGVPEAPLRGLTVYGKTVQDGTPSVDAPVELDSVGDDGDVVVSVMAGLPDAIFIIKQPRNFAGSTSDTAIFEVIALGYGLTYQWQWLGTATTSEWANTYVDGYSTARIIVPVTQARDGFRYRCVITDANGHTVATKGALLTVGDVAESDDAADDTQTATISTAEGLCGVPVASGAGTYTDADGQAWIADTIEYDADMGTAKYIKRTGTKTLDETAAWKKSTNANVDRYYTNLSDYDASLVPYMLCSIGTVKTTKPSEISVGFVGIDSNKNLSINYAAAGTTTLDDFLAYIAENPITVVYPIASPVETPISTTLFYSLKTINPVTTIYNDENAYMDVVYSTVANSHGASIGGMDYLFDHPYEYAVRMNGRSIVCDSFSCSAFRLLIYGECINPTVNIGDHAYTVNGTVGSGETLMIDSMAKTITLTTAYGNTVNYFDKRSRESYIFEPIPAGKNDVTWSGDFGFELTIIEKRSEPKWT